MAYSTAYVPDVITGRLRQSTLLGLFVRVETDPALHIWFGVNDIPAQFDAIDETGQVYFGGGQLIGFPTLEVLLNGASDVVDFTLSGVDPKTGARLIDSLPPVRGAAVHVGITTLDDFYQPMSRVIPIWCGVAARTAESMPTVSGAETPSLTLALSVVGGENMRSRPSRALWSQAQQQALAPGDDFCKATALLARGVQRAWPNY